MQPTDRPHAPPRKSGEVQPNPPLPCLTTTHRHISKEHHNIIIHTMAPTPFKDRPLGSTLILFDGECGFVCARAWFRVVSDCTFLVVLLRVNREGRGKENASKDDGKLTWRAVHTFSLLLPRICSTSRWYPHPCSSCTCRLRIPLGDVTWTASAWSSSRENLRMARKLTGLLSSSRHCLDGCT